MIESGTHSRQAIANIYGIGKSTVHDIHRKRNQIRQFAEMTNDISKRRRVDTKKDKTPVMKTEDIELHEEIIEDSRLNGDFDYQALDEDGQDNYEVIYEPDIKNEQQESLLIDSSFHSGKKKTTLTIREKYDIVKMIEGGTSVPEVCSLYNIGRTTAYDFLKRKQAFIDFIENSSNDGSNRRTLKQSKFPIIEENMVEYCETTHHFTKQQFFDTLKIFSSNFKSEFCGAWSWSKRFFHRHPEYRQKLIGDNGKSIKDITFLDDNAEYLDDEIENGRASEKMQLREIKEKFSNSRLENPGDKKPYKYLNLGEKLQVLNEIDNGVNIHIIADRHDVSKSTVYEIFKRREELRDVKKTKSNIMRKVMKIPRFPELEKELLKWCMRQKKYPLSNVLIADQALCMFCEMGLEGKFNPSSTWGKNFSLRYPELRAKQGIPDEDEIDETEFDETFLQNGQENEDIESEETIEDSEENSMPFEFLDPENPEYVEEILEPENCIIESFESTNPSSVIEKDDILVNTIPESHIKNNERLAPSEPAVIKLVPDSIALKSLNILIKYSKQRGKSKYLQNLLEYKNEFEQHDLELEES